MAGYTRQDTANNIANGSVIDADDLDGEFNAVESAFNASSGHAHDGSAGQGSPVTKVGPGQDIIVGTSTLLPKANNIIDLGSSAAQFKDGYFDGTLYADTANLGVNGYTTIIDNSYTVSTGDLTLDVAGDITLDADGGDVLLKDGGVSFGKLTNNSNQLSIFSGSVETLRLNGSATSALGTLAVTGNTTVGGTLAITGNTTLATANLTLNSGNVVVGGTVSATGGFTGALTGNVTGTVSSVANHDTGDITEGSNLYHTTARARGAISATGSLSYNSTSGVMSFTQGNTDTIAEGSSNLYHTTARARGAISATGNISYNSSTGVISLATNQDVTFDDVIVGGNLTVNGTTTTVNSNTVNIGDNIITLNSDETGTPSQDAGITIERGTSTNKSLVWTESTDKWGVGSETFVAGTFEGNLTGNVTGAVTGAVTGNASTATALANARTIDITGDITATAVSFDGTSNIAISASVNNDSHTHDGRYYTETESDSRFTASAGDTMTGTLTFNDNVVCGFGNSNDFEIFHNNTHAYMDINKGNLYIRDTTTTRFTFDDNGSFTATGNVTAYSDERLKSNIVTIPNALETVGKLRGVNFIKDGEASTGVIAQEVQKVIPEVVLEGGEYLSVAYGNLVGVLIEAVKELKEEVQQLKDGSV
jgi:hypothetical protein